MRRFTRHCKKLYHHIIFIMIRCAPVASGNADSCITVFFVEGEFSKNIHQQDFLLLQCLCQRQCFSVYCDRNIGKPIVIQAIRFCFISRLLIDPQYFRPFFFARGRDAYFEIQIACGIPVCFYGGRRGRQRDGFGVIVPCKPPLPRGQAGKLCRCK